MLMRTSKKARQRDCKTKDKRGEGTKRKECNEEDKKREDEKPESAIIMKVREIGEVKMVRGNVSLSLRLMGGIRVNGAGAF